MSWFWSEEKVECEISDEDIEKLRKDAKTHITHMLGEPAIKLELDETQIYYAIDHAIELIDYVGIKNEKEYSILFKSLSLAFATYMLGRIRVKLAVNSEVSADGFSLINEANRDIEAFFKRIKI